MIETDFASKKLTQGAGFGFLTTIERCSDVLEAGIYWTKWCADGKVVLHRCGSGGIEQRGVAALTN